MLTRKENDVSFLSLHLLGKMVNINQTIEKFKISCFNMANNEANEMFKQIDFSLNENINQEIKEYEKEKQKEYEKKLIKLEHNFNSCIYEANYKAKQKLNQRKKELEEEIKKEFIKIVEIFMDSDQYEEFLIKNIRQAMERLNIETNDEISIFVIKKDKERFEKKIQKIFECSVLELEDSYIGGALLVNQTKNILVNNTIATIWGQV